MNEIRFETTGSNTDIYTPYNPEFISRLKSSLGTRKYSPEKRCWTIDTADLDQAKAIVRDVFGWSDGTQKEVRVRITFNESVDADRTSVWLGGLEIARARGRDSGAVPGKGVALVAGSIGSGGSVKNWTTEVHEGAQFIATLPEEMAAKIQSDSEWDISVEIIGSVDPDYEALEKEKKQLLERLAEIEKQLAERR